MRSLKELPENNIELKINIHLTNSQMNILRKGKGAASMDDRWIIYYKDSWLYFHRSWTGVCIYKARIEEASDSSKLTEVLINGDTKEYKYMDDEKEISLFIELFNLFLDDKL